MLKDLDITASEQIRLSARGYKTIKKLGVGTYAAVYLVEYKNFKNGKVITLACKIMDTTKMAKEFVKKFLPRELDILSQLNHPHIIQIQNIFQRRAKYFIFMRYAENGDLLEFVLKKGSLSEAQARVWFRQIALAIQYLHAMDIAHRDLKCENIFITANFNLKLADFGFARIVVDSRGGRVTSDTYCGSLSYASPEILRGVPYYPKIADMWSLGIILYIMINKAMPFDDGNVKRLYDQQVNKRWRFRAKVLNLISDKCKTLTAQMLEPDIHKRWTAEQVVCSDWIAMDAQLLQLTPSELNALKTARAQKSRRSSGTSVASSSSIQSPKRSLDTARLPSVFSASGNKDSVHDLTVAQEDKVSETASESSIPFQTLLQDLPK